MNDWTSFIPITKYNVKMIIYKDINKTATIVAMEIH